MWRSVIPSLACRTVFLAFGTAPAERSHAQGIHVLSLAASVRYLEESGIWDRVHETASHQPTSPAPAKTCDDAIPRPLVRERAATIDAIHGARYRPLERPRPPDDIPHRRARRAVPCSNRLTTRCGQPATVGQRVACPARKPAHYACRGKKKPQNPKKLGGPHRTLWATLSIRARSRLTRNPTTSVGAPRGVPCSNRLTT